MVPIQHLLNRIRWDKEFGSGFFEIGYVAHIERRIVRVPLGSAHFELGNRFAFQLEDETHEMRTIPYHRVRVVYRNGALIWQRSG
jgi:uncharacterized protein (UPF0248 family)